MNSEPLEDDVMTDCANCGSFACRGQKEKTPPNCPMDQFPEVYEEAMEQYLESKTNRMARMAAIVEATGYCKWTRLEEIIEFARRTDFNRLGLAFCAGLRTEGRKVAPIASRRAILTSPVCLLPMSSSLPPSSDNLVRWDCRPLHHI